jgi:outer membrane protein assembly factor BamB
MSRRWQRFAILALAGFVLLGLAFKFRHRIQHFRPHIRFRTLQSITISPPALEIPQGARRRLTVVAHYRDGSAEESPANVQWASSSPGVARVSPEGIVVAESVASAAVQAKLNDTTTTANVSVVPSTPVALAIFPASEAIPVGGTVQYKVIATSSDDSVMDVTRFVKWNVSNPLAVELSLSGLAHAKTAGRTILNVELVTPLGTIETNSVLTATWSPHAFDGVFTYRYDDTGTGQNRFETLLNPKNVNARTFGKLFAAPVDGYVYAQPLYVPNVSIQGQNARNVVYAATEHDTVFAFDAENGAELFHKNLGSAVPEKALPCKDMGPEIGITGTPVIDPDTKTMYVVAKVYENGVSSFRLHALDIASGDEKPGSPVLISATVVGNGGGSHDGSVTFAASNQLQRPGLRIVRGQVVVTFGSLCDYGTFHGWVFLYHASTLKQTAVFLTTPDGHHGGIWQAGAAPAVDSAGNIYVVSGDGEFDPNQQRANFGDTILKLRSNGVGTLAPSDYFTPYDQRDMDVENGDLGSGGPILLPDQLGQHPHLLFAAAKNGAIYLLDRDNMGHFQSTSNSQIVQYLPHLFAGKVHASAGYWRNATEEWVYISSVEGKLQALPLSHGRLSPTPASETTMSFTYPGVTPVISSRGNDDGIVWALENYAGVLRAFSATDLTKELYNSSQAKNGRDRAERGVQFYVPAVANGKVYFGSRGHLYAYGLLR